MIKIWTFILLLPALVILGHDLYMAYGDEVKDVKDIGEITDVEVDPDHFSFSGVGRLWMTYAPDSLNEVRNNVSLATWEGLVAPFLEQTAILVALVPLVIMYIVLGSMYALGIGPFTGGTRKIKTVKNTRHFDVYDKHKEKKVKYGRK